MEVIVVVCDRCKKDVPARFEIFAKGRVWMVCHSCYRQWIPNEYSLPGVVSRFDAFGLRSHFIQDAKLLNQYGFSNRDVDGIKSLWASVMSFVTQAVEKGGAGLLISGVTGIGKTAYSYAVRNYCRTLGKSPSLVLWEPFFESAIEAIADGNRLSSVEMYPNQDADILIVDDLTRFPRDVSFSARIIKTWVDNVIDNRTTQGLARSLMLTTNLPLSELFEKLGPEVQDRLQAFCQKVEINIKSFRGTI